MTRWTFEMDRRLREHYASPIRRRGSARALAADLGVKQQALYDRAQRIGLSAVKSRREWLGDERRIIRDHPTRTVRAIENALACAGYNRSACEISRYLVDGGDLRPDSILTTEAACRMLGVRQSVLNRWKATGRLASRMATRADCVAGDVFTVEAIRDCIIAVRWDTRLCDPLLMSVLLQPKVRVEREVPSARDLHVQRELRRLQTAVRRLRSERDEARAAAGYVEGQSLDDLIGRGDVGLYAAAFGLSPSEARMLHDLHRRGLWAKQDGLAEMTEGTARVVVVRLRSRLAAFGIEFRTLRNVGYAMGEAMRAKVGTILCRHTREVAA